MDNPTIITDTLRVERSSHGKQRLSSAADPVKTRRRNATSRQEQADLRAALRFHVLKGIASGEYAKEADAAREFGVSRVWVAKAAPVLST